MTKTIDEMMAVMSAAKGGQPIEYGEFTGGEWVWREALQPVWNWQRHSYRVRPEPEPEPDYIPWDAIKGYYQWAARDQDGKIFVYAAEPELNNVEWRNRGEAFIRIDHFLTVKVGNVGWTKTKTRRPS